MNVICLEEPVFYALINKVIEYIKMKETGRLNKWVNQEEA